MTGHCRWPILEPFVEGGEQGAVRSTVTGRLYDTGLDYPAARFDHPGLIHGEAFELRSARVDEALSVIDRVEGGVEGAYHRIQAQTSSSLPVWAYQFGGSTEGLVDLNGRWTGV